MEIRCAASAKCHAPDPPLGAEGFRSRQDIAAEASVKNPVEFGETSAQWVNIGGEAALRIETDQFRTGIPWPVFLSTRTTTAKPIAPQPHPPHGDRPAFDRALTADDEAGCQGLM